MKAEDVVIETQFFLRESLFVHGWKLREDPLISGYIPNGSKLASTTILEFSFTGNVGLHEERVLR